MADLIEFFSSNDNLIIIGLMSIIVILIAIILLIDIKAKKQTEKNLEFMENNDTDNQEVINGNIDNYPPTNDITEIKYVETNDELEKTKAKIELETLKAELQKAELENIQEEKNEVAENSVEQQNVSTLEPQKNSIDIFEDEQEEKAIISVEELTKKADELNDQNEITQYEDEGNEPISIQELEALYKASTEVSTTETQKDTSVVPQSIKMEESFTLKPSTEIKIQNTKFTSTPFISPVYGINENETRDNSLDNINLEQTANLEKLNEELKKVNEFLVALKELKNKLQ